MKENIYRSMSGTLGIGLDHPLPWTPDMCLTQLVTDGCASIIPPPPSELWNPSLLFRVVFEWFELMEILVGCADLALRSILNSDQEAG